MHFQDALDDVLLVDADGFLVLIVRRAVLVVDRGRMAAVGMRGVMLAARVTGLLMPMA